MPKKKNKANEQGSYTANELTAIKNRINALDVEKAAAEGEPISAFTYGLGRNLEQLQRELSRFAEQYIHLPKEQNEAYNNRLAELILTHLGKTPTEVEGQKLDELQEQIPNQAAFHADREQLDQEFADFIEEKLAIQAKNEAKAKERFLHFDPYLIKLEHAPQGLDLRPVSNLIAEPEP